jgi:hypothetical protein
MMFFFPSRSGFSSTPLTSSKTVLVWAVKRVPLAAFSDKAQLIPFGLRAEI